ncbi:hypothetical protein JCM9140_1438 [Halalkalibacter wakoensis JCM 9140]|uniref:Putative peptidoglycan binding domain-containing protein n=1 Tax=Halalkalibacter wakoensis JCM 9140 TaxID=1236970 RepID=W4Q0E6_9BACI|nr:DUF1028 domain-containing protein [Halalkalibacter wakoensis]GAE25442.1 hypothetical protein JCM9140_1438 [Halalkalibacter wakoensis JCM 9140]
MKNDLIHTFSIVGFDPETGELGVAVASKFLGVGAIVPWARAGAGAVATQSWANKEYGQKGLELLEQGKSAEEVIQHLTQADEGIDLRQVGIVSARGDSATFTGRECYQWAGGLSGPHFACQGNILVDEKTVKVMADTFTTMEGSLAERLLEALYQGQEAGGDSRGKQSACLLVVKEGAGYGGTDDQYIDLRVDDHQEPIVELKRLFDLHQLYFNKPNPEDMINIEGGVRDRLITNLTILEYLAEDPTMEELTEAIQSFHLIENFDERVLEPGLIDKKVIEYMEKLAAQK